MKKKGKNPILLALFGSFIFLLLFVAAAFLRGDERVKGLVEKSGRLAVRSFQILGLDGKGKNPRERMKKEEEGTTKVDVELIRVGEEMISYPEYMFYLLASRKKFEMNFGEEIWKERQYGKEISKLLKEEIASEIVQLKIIKKQAEKKGIVLTEKEKKELASSANEQFLGIEPILIAKHYLDVELLTKIYEENFLASKYYEEHKREQDSTGRFMPGQDLFQRDFLEWKKEYEVEIFVERIEEIEF